MVIRNLCLSIIVLFILFPVHAQEPLEKYISELETISANIPEDQVFVHTDRNLYSAGDTIFFQAYIQDRVLQQVQTASKSIYVILQNSASELIDSARFKITSSMAPGYLTLPDTVSPGYYRMLSYTSLMQNFDPKFCNTSWLRVDELKSEAVNTVFSFDKASYSPNDTAEVLIQLSDQTGSVLKNEAFTYSLVIDDVPGNHYKVSSNTLGESTLNLVIPDSIENYDVSIEINLQKRNFITRKSIPKNIDEIHLRFLPEGGTFSFGIKQQLAFNAVDKQGEQLYISGIVKNSQGQFIDSINSSDLGSGIIEFTPIKGETYFAEIQGYPDTIFDLPLPSDGIPVLRVEHLEHSIIVRVSSPAAASRNDILVFRKNNKVLVSKEIDSTYQAFKFDTKNLPQGTAGFLLLDEHLNPVAERMVYLNAFKQVNMNISPAKKVYQPGEEAEISFSLSDSLNSNPPALFSVAVVDSVTGFYPNLLTANIEESFLFDEQFYNNLPAHIKFRGLTGMSQEELDILMMTYGWKRFSKEKPSGESLSSLNREAERIYYDMLKLIIDDNFTNRQTKK